MSKRENPLTPDVTAVTIPPMQATPITMRLPPALARQAVEVAARLNASADPRPRPWTHADVLREALAEGMRVVLARHGLGGDGA